MQNAPLGTKQNFYAWQKKLPTWITLSRVVLVIPIVYFLVPSGWGGTVAGRCIAAVLFAIAAITDYYDGYFARKYDSISNFGKFMDPVADKILVSSILVMLVHLQKIDPYMVMLILARDTFIGGIRSIAAADHFVIDAKPTGKWKTALQMGAIPAMMIGGDLFSPTLHLEQAGYFVLWLSVLLSLASGLEYFHAYQNALSSRS